MRCTFEPADFLGLFERERRWIEVLITAILTRRELQDLNVKLLSEDTVACALQTRARALRN